MNKGQLYLIPSTLGDYPPEQSLPASVIQIACSLKVFVVEDTRSARRFLSKCGLKGHIDELEFHELNEHTPENEVQSLLSLFEKGNVGLISEAGLPAVADPGALLVALCHRNGIEVMPLVGPCSLMLALMASGLNGQSFRFCGYIPAKSEERRSYLRKLEIQSAASQTSEIMIETPYRNDALLSDMLQCLKPNTQLCIAADICLPSQFIKTASISNWRKQSIVIGKRPCVFILLAK